jgi:hypothetical protein
MEGLISRFGNTEKKITVLWRTVVKLALPAVFEEASDSKLYDSWIQQLRASAKGKQERWMIRTRAIKCGCSWLLGELTQKTLDLRTYINRIAGTASPLICS